MELPVYKCQIDETLESDLQVEFVALLDRPAIEKNFMAFEEAKKTPLHFEVNEDRHIITGPAMLADLLIYRNDEHFGEYYTMFDKQSIYAIVQKFFKKGFNQNFNLFHDPLLTANEGVTMFESFITDKERGIMPMKGFEDVADGSWFISAKIDNEEIWQKVKDGTLKGFSVEGI